MAYNATEKNEPPPDTGEGAIPRSVRFEVYGVEMIEKTVKSSGDTGRIYLPSGWVGKAVKIIRIE